MRYLVEGDHDGRRNEYLQGFREEPFDDQIDEHLEEVLICEAACHVFVELPISPVSVEGAVFFDMPMNASVVALMGIKNK